MSSNPQNETVEYPNGDVIQYFTCEFFLNSFSGKIHIDKVEVKSAEFLDFESFQKLPKNERSTFESLDFFRKKGKVHLR